MADLTEQKEICIKAFEDILGVYAAVNEIQPEEIAKVECSSALMVERGTDETKVVGVQVENKMEEKAVESEAEKSAETDSVKENGAEENADYNSILSKYVPKVKPENVAGDQTVAPPMNRTYNEFGEIVLVDGENNKNEISLDIPTFTPPEHNEQNSAEPMGKVNVEPQVEQPDEVEPEPEQIEEVVEDDTVEEVSYAEPISKAELEETLRGLHLDITTGGLKPEGENPDEEGMGR